MKRIKLYCNVIYYNKVKLNLKDANFFQKMNLCLIFKKNSIYFNGQKYFKEVCFKNAKLNLIVSKPFLRTPNPLLNFRKYSKRIYEAVFKEISSFKKKMNTFHCFGIYKKIFRTNVA